MSEIIKLTKAQGNLPLRPLCEGDIAAVSDQPGYQNSGNKKHSGFCGQAAE